jgi:hypothetical protein
MFDKKIWKFIPLNDNLQLKLFLMVLRKQLHECQNFGFDSSKRKNSILALVLILKIRLSFDPILVTQFCIYLELKSNLDYMVFFSCRVSTLKTSVHIF